VADIIAHNAHDHAWDANSMKPGSNIGVALWAFISGATLYFLFMLVFTVVFDERRPVYASEYLPLVALVPVAAYLLAGRR
jgi:hypothetical protein